jgi:predicted RNA polymerase sigma factor
MREADNASSSGPELQRTDVSSEAIRLTRIVRELLPNNREVAATPAPHGQTRME